MAQPQFQYTERLDETKGLSSNEVNRIAQDQNGFLWIATQNGLNRYDGASFKHYFAGEEENSLSDNVIIEILSLDQHHFLLATRKGLNVLDTRDYTFKRISFPKFSDNPKEQNLDQYVYFLKEDFNGNIWVATTFHIYRFDRNLKLQNSFYSGFRLVDIAEKGRRYIYKFLPFLDGTMMIWMNHPENPPMVWTPKNKDKLIELDKIADSKWHFMTNQYYSHFFRVGDHYITDIDYSNRKIKIIDELTDQSATCLLPKEYQWKQESLSAIKMFKDGWIALCFSNEGLVWVHLENRQGKMTLESDTTICLSDFNIWQIFEDKDNTIFLNDRYKGLWKIALQKQKFNKINLGNQKDKNTSPYEVTSLFQEENNLWIATYGEGVYQWDETSGKVKRFSLKTSAIWSDYVWNFSSHSKDTLWVGTQNGLVWLHKENGNFGRLPQSHPRVLDSVAITTNFVDSKGVVWMGLGNLKGLCSYDFQQRKFEIYSYKKGTFPYAYPPYGITEDKEGNLWFAIPTTADLVKWTQKEKQFKVITLPEFQDIDNVNHGNILFDRKNNILWLGIMSAGLAKYDLNTTQLNVYRPENEKRFEGINGITMDKFGILWLSTNMGLSSFDPAREKYTHWSSSDGLPATHIPSFLLYDTIKNRIFGGHSGHVIYFTPTPQENKSTIRAVITDVLIGNQPVSIPKDRHFILGSKENDLTISFTGVNLTNGEENQYAYRLNDNEDWIFLKNQKQVRFANLSPGNYRFSVRVASKGSDWSDWTDTVKITIHKPFYATFWFYLLLSGIVYGIIFGIYRYRLSKIKQLVLMRAQISHDLHDEIGSRLTNISMISQILETKEIQKDQQEQWLDKIKKESERISQNLREIVWNINPDNDSLEEAMPRMLKYAADILEAKGISIHAQIPELKNIHLNMDKRRNLMAIFKEAVQNILKHADAENVTILVLADKKTFRLEVTDDGKGFEMNDYLISNGLKYMWQRAEQFKWNIEINSSPGKGTQIILEIKII